MARRVQTSRAIQPDMQSASSAAPPSMEEYCAEHSGVRHGAEGMASKSFCMCGKTQGRQLVCAKNGSVGCGPNSRDLQWFSASEIADNAECIPDPCAARGDTLSQTLVDSKRQWYCDDHVENSQKLAPSIESLVTPRDGYWARVKT